MEGFPTSGLDRAGRKRSWSPLCVPAPLACFYICIQDTVSLLHFKVVCGFQDPRKLQSPCRPGDDCLTVDALCCVYLWSLGQSPPQAAKHPGAVRQTSWWDRRDQRDNYPRSIEPSSRAFNRICYTAEMPTAVSGLQVGDRCGLSLPAQQPTPASMQPGQWAYVGCARWIHALSRPLKVKCN